MSDLSEQSLTVLRCINDLQFVGRDCLPGPGRLSFDPVPHAAIAAELHPCTYDCRDVLRGLEIDEAIVREVLPMVDIRTWLRPDGKTVVLSMSVSEKWNRPSMYSASVDVDGDLVCACACSPHILSREKDLDGTFHEAWEWRVEYYRITKEGRALLSQDVVFEGTTSDVMNYMECSDQTVRTRAEDRKSTLVRGESVYVRKLAHGKYQVYRPRRGSSQG